MKESLVSRLISRKNIWTKIEINISYFAGLYFSAHWCPPCRGFTPKLIDYYNGWQAAKKDTTLEIIFVSSDRTAEECEEYYKDMPWVALKHGSDKKVGKHDAPIPHRQRNNRIIKNR